MASLNRFAILDSDDEEEAPAIPKQKQVAAPAPAPKKKNNNRNNRGRGDGRGGRGRGRGGRGGGRGRRDDYRGRGGDDYRGRRDFDDKADGRERRRRDDGDRARRGTERRTRQPRNGESARRGGRDPKKAGHGGIGTHAQEAAAGEAEVRGDAPVVDGEGDAEAEAVPEEPVDTGLTVAEYNAKVLAEKRAALAALTGGPKPVRTVEQIDGERLVRDSEGVVKKYGVAKTGAGSKKKKKGFVSAEKFFGTQARQQPRSDDRRGGGRYGDRDDRRGGRDDRRGRRDDRRGYDDRRGGGGGGGQRQQKININNTNDFPSLS